MIEAEWWEYESMDDLANEVAGDFGFIIESALDARGDALVALPGGSTPLPIYRKLAEKKLNWKRVTIIPTDERIVPVDSDLSNIKSIATSFITSGARIYPIAIDSEDHKAAGNAADARLQDLPWPPDLVWLGMGEDGHTASIFDGPDLQDALETPKRAVGVMPDPMPENAPVARVTLSRSAILAARTLTIVITGDKKKDLLEQAIEDGHSSKLPIGKLLANAEQPIDIHWCP